MVDSYGALGGQIGIVEAGLVDKYHRGASGYGNRAAGGAQGFGAGVCAVSNDDPLGGKVCAALERDGNGAGVGVMDDGNVVPFGGGVELIIHGEGHHVLGVGVSPTEINGIVAGVGGIAEGGISLADFDESFIVGNDVGVGDGICPFELIDGGGGLVAVFISILAAGKFLAGLEEGHTL